MKRLVPLILVIILMLGLAACRKKPASPDDVGATAAQSGTPEDSNTTPAVTTEEIPKGIVLADNAEVFFAITDLNAENAIGYAMTAYLENRTDKDLFFTFDTASVNGRRCNPYWATPLPAGKSDDAFIGWVEEELAALNITSVTEISFTLSVYDPADWLIPPLFSESFTLTP